MKFPTGRIGIKSQRVGTGVLIGLTGDERPFGVYGAHPDGSTLLLEIGNAMRRLDRDCGIVALGVHPGWTYAIRQASGASLIKIGQTVDPIDRLTNIQAMNATSLELINLCHFTSTEGDLHWRHRARRRHGEWFDIGSFELMPKVGARCFGCALQRKLTNA